MGCHTTDKIIKVLHIHTLPVVSGSGLNTFLSMRGLNKERYRAELACAPQGKLIKLVTDNGMEVRCIEHFRREVNIIEDISALFELIGLLRRGKYDIVHTHNSKAGVIGRLAARLAGVPIIIHTLHSCVFKYSNLSRIQRRFYFYIEKFCALITDKLITISEPLKEDFIDAGISRPGKYITIYSGIELDRFTGKYDTIEKKNELGIPLDNLVVGTVSRIAEGKGLEELLAAARSLIIQLKNVVFLIVGDGPLSDKIKNLAKNLEVDKNVIFTGARDDIEQITSIFDIAVLPSHYEGMGRVLLEAQASGKPVVATRAGGIKEIVKDNQTGILVACGSEKDLVCAIYKLLTDEGLRKNMGEAAAKWVDERFSSRRMVAQITDLYEELLSKC